MSHVEWVQLAYSVLVSVLLYLCERVNQGLGEKPLPHPTLDTLSENRMPLA